VEESVRRVSPEWIAVGIAGSSLAVGLLTLVVVLLILRSVRQSKQAGDERLELLREQRQRLEFMNTERRLLEEELESQRRASAEGARSDPRLKEEDERRAEARASPETPPVERPEGEEVWLDAASPQESSERPWWRRVFGG
jgi:hypothetical protein